MKPKYLACIWCGKKNTRGVFAQYCSEKCKREALGQKPIIKKPYGKQETNWTEK
jgi:hypothetical protein